MKHLQLACVDIFGASTTVAITPNSTGLTSAQHEEAKRFDAERVFDL
ncbi:MAG TPA: hypothetical protein VFO91_10565 [Anaerolineales bacterium]|nr:hypothetical protein [Anaerolineales bacterium]